MQIQSIHSGKPFTIRVIFIRKRLSAIERKKSCSPSGISKESLKLAGKSWFHTSRECWILRWTIIQFHVSG